VAEMGLVLLPMLNSLPFVPELSSVNGKTFVVHRPAYPLRPEVVESILMAYQATRDSSLLVFALQSYS
jgi:hypothetical protein